jgi:hypothetical protein
MARSKCDTPLVLYIINNGLQQSTCIAGKEKEKLLKVLLSLSSSYFLSCDIP